MSGTFEVVFPVTGNVCITVEAGDVKAAIEAATDVFQRLKLERDLADDLPLNVWRAFVVKPNPLLDVNHDECAGVYVFDETGKVVTQ